MATNTVQDSRVESLPSLNDYRAVERALGEAHETVEVLVGRLRAYIDAHLSRDNPATASPLPTLADVGALWSFVDGLRLDADDLSNFTRTVERWLSQIDGMRMEGSTSPRQEATMPETVAATLNLSEDLQAMEDAFRQQHDARLRATETLDRLVFALDNVGSPGTVPDLPVTFWFGIVYAARDLAANMHGHETQLSMDEELAESDDLLALVRAAIGWAEQRDA